MFYERFSDRARKTMQLANQEARRFNHEYIATEHILLGLVKEGSGVAANVLKNMSIDLNKIRIEVEKLTKQGSQMVTLGKLPQTQSTRKVIELSIRAAKDLNHNYIGTEHILLGLLAEGNGVACKVLTSLGIKSEELKDEILQLLGHDMTPEDIRRAESQKKELFYNGVTFVGVAKNTLTITECDADVKASCESADRAKRLQTKPESELDLSRQYPLGWRKLRGMVKIEDPENIPNNILPELPTGGWVRISSMYQLDSAGTELIWEVLDVKLSDRFKEESKQEFKPRNSELGAFKKMLDAVQGAGGLPKSEIEEKESQLPRGGFF